MATMTAEQKRRILEFVPVFKAYCKSDQAEIDTQARQARLALFAPLTKDRILQMDEADILALITQLWATKFWKNQQYILDKIISSNGLEKLRRALAELLCGRETVAVRYEHFLENIKYLGPASVTEMLASKTPDQCAIWNDKARKALTVLSFEDSLPLTKYRITGEELARFNEVCLGIAGELEAAGLPKPDLFGVDYYLYEVAQAALSPAIASPKPEQEKKFDHDEIGEHLRDIGLWLGFEADIRQKVSHGAEVDVLWRAQIGNLGIVTYVFEVQKSGSIDSLILNLQRARANPTVQKVVAVSDGQQLDRIRRETVGLPAEFRDALALMSVSDVETIYANLSKAMSLIEQLQLVNDIFPIGTANGER
jgi:hypothetical protein